MLPWTILLPHLWRFGLPALLTIGIGAAWYVQGFRVSAANIRADREILRADTAEKSRDDLLAALKLAGMAAADLANRQRELAGEAQKRIDEIRDKLNNREPIAQRTVLETRNVYIHSGGLCNDPTKPNPVAVPGAADSDDPERDYSIAAAQAAIDRAWEQAAACIGTIESLNGKTFTLQIGEAKK